MSHARAYYKHIGTSHGNFHVLFSIKFILLPELLLSLLFFRPRGTWMHSPSLSVIRCVCISNVSAAGFLPAASISIVDTFLVSVFRYPYIDSISLGDNVVERDPFLFLFVSVIAIRDACVCTSRKYNGAVYLFSILCYSRILFLEFCKKEREQRTEEHWTHLHIIDSKCIIVIINCSARCGREFCVLVFWRVHYARFVLLWLFFIFKL